MNRQNLITVYNPSLSALLLAAEKDKGAPLTVPEVLAIRDSATVLNVPAEHAQQLEQKRGYKDINADNVWAEWQELKKRC